MPFIFASSSAFAARIFARGIANTRMRDFYDVYLIYIKDDDERRIKALIIKQLDYVTCFLTPTSFFCFSIRCALTLFRFIICIFQHFAII